MNVNRYATDGLHSQARPVPECREDPAAVFSRVAGQPGALFFDSAAAGGADKARISVVCWEPEGELTGPVGELSALRRWLEAHRIPWLPGVPYPLGGAFGQVSYEGDFRFGLYRNLLIFLHETGEWIEVGRARHWLDLPVRPSGAGERLRFQPRTTRGWFEAAVERAQDYIAAGDIYQVNLCQCFQAQWPAQAEPWGLYRTLREVSPAPYAAFLDWGDQVLLSSSPELFLRLSGRSVETRPIKGTRPRYAEPRDDARAAQELTGSEKERAELVMITDLERNDLGQFCEYGSVEVSELAKLERFEQVHHLVSTVRGTLARGCDAVEAFLLAFPGGSITGAPKKRAIEIIRELEGEARGAYTGAIGYFGLNGESQFGIAIRTAELRGAMLEFRTGAGIVADSRPGAEFEETLHKAAGMFRAAEIWGGTEERIASGGEFRRMVEKDGVGATVL